MTNTKKCLIRKVGWGAGGLRGVVFLRVAREGPGGLCKQRPRRREGGG